MQQSENPKKSSVCRMCNGSGKYSKNKEEPKRTCPNCRGSGRSSGYLTK